MSEKSEYRRPHSDMILLKTNDQCIPTKYKIRLLSARVHKKYKTFVIQKTLWE